jgi:hypothetical protein
MRPHVRAAVDVAHLREVLGEETYESLAHDGEPMTTAAMATYAYDQIDQARTELQAASKWTTYATLIDPLAGRVIPHVAMSHMFVSQRCVSSSTLEY